MNPSELGELALLRELQREQMRLRVRLAVVLIASICAFALFLSWLAQRDPLRPLLTVQLSLIALLSVYAVSVVVVAIYARWIRVRREPAVLAVKNGKAQ